MVSTFLKIFCAFIFPSIISADETVNKYQCFFDRYVSMNTPNLSRTKFEFEIIRLNDSEAIIHGQHIEKALVVQNMYGGFTTIEKTASGNVITTSISKDGTAVSSRNIVSRGKLFPAQYYGKCIKK